MVLRELNVASSYESVDFLIRNPDLTIKTNWFRSSLTGIGMLFHSEGFVLEICFVVASIISHSSWTSSCFRYFMIPSIMGFSNENSFRTSESTAMFRGVSLKNYHCYCEIFSFSALCKATLIACPGLMGDTSSLSSVLKVSNFDSGRFCSSLFWSKSTPSD